MKASKQFVEKYYIQDLEENSSPEGQWASKWAKEVSGKKVLNIGCGPQLYDDALLFLEIPEELVGIDLNEANIEFLERSFHPKLLESKRKLQEHGSVVRFFVQDVKEEREDFIGKFDSVYASGLLGMFSKADTEHIFKLIHKYLKPGGRVVMVSWGDDHLSPEKFAERESYGWFWRNGPGIEEIGEIIKRAGFNIIKQDTYKVSDPIEYEWGLIYSYVAKKLG